MNSRGLDKSELKEFRSLLLEQSKILRGDLDGLEEETRGKGADRASDQSSVPGHLAELASDATEQSISYGRMESQTEELKEIDDAFDRIKDGSFGLCENCQSRIPKERLKAIPYARRCVPCQGKEESL